MNKSFWILVLALGVIQAQASGGGSSIGPGNPAAILCAELKGESQAYETSLGQNAFCAFEKGAIEQWTLFRHVKGGSEQAVDALRNWEAPTGPLAGNPAASYCIQRGGQIVWAVDVLSKGQFALCEFPDHSQIEEWTLFRGPNDLSNQLLMKALEN